ncbi:hypothetical protein ACE1CI_11495 [Aerosakkonemataceae cyanobacterium BLCC-F50]|uniref:Acid shock protein n=1 Tax=Floridaenema flaviceps BLCC-F50 TaxID=3153642 RepID=A0ABV4XP87_9CYAN
MKKLFSALLLSAVVVAPVGFSFSAAQAATAKTHHQMTKAHPHRTHRASIKTNHVKRSHAVKPHKSNVAMRKQ